MSDKNYGITLRVINLNKPIEYNPHSKIFFTKLSLVYGTKTNIWIATEDKKSLHIKVLIS